jgi:hypothetical protein
MILIQIKNASKYKMTIKYQSVQAKYRNIEVINLILTYFRLFIAIILFKHYISEVEEIQSNVYNIRDFLKISLTISFLWFFYVSPNCKSWIFFSQIFTFRTNSKQIQRCASIFTNVCRVKLCFLGENKGH